MRGYFESYENEVLTFITHYPWGVDLFIDGGANIGFFSYYIALTKDWKVIAVEPFPENVTYIQDHQRNNKIEFTLVDKALDATGQTTKTLFFPSAKGSSKLSTSASLVNSFAGSGKCFDHLSCKTLQVQTVTLAEIAGEGDLKRLIKLDCEGNELSILGAAESLLTQEHNDFILEIMINDTDKHEVHSLMTSFGYQAYLLTNAGLVREDRPLTMPYPNVKNRTLWKNHFYTKKNVEIVRDFSLKAYGYWV